MATSVTLLTEKSSYANPTTVAALVSLDRRSRKDPPRTPLNENQVMQVWSKLVMDIHSAKKYFLKRYEPVHTVSALFTLIRH